MNRISENDSSKQKSLPDKNWQKWENVIQEILGSPQDRLAPSQDKKALGAGEQFFDRSGKVISDQSKLPDGEPIVSLRSDISGAKVLKIFADKNDFKEDRPLLSESFTYRQDGSRLYEDRKIETPNHGITNLQNTFDQESLHLTFGVESSGLKQEIVLNSDSKLEKFEMNFGQNQLAYKIENGSIVGLTMLGPDGKSKSLSDSDATKFIAAAEVAVASVRFHNGIPIPMDTGTEVARLDIPKLEPYIFNQSQRTLSNDADMSRAITSSDMQKTLVAEALKTPQNINVRAVLADISSSNKSILEKEDPLLTAVRAQGEMRPDMREKMATAALVAAKSDSRRPIEAQVADLAAKDPKFDQIVKEIISSQLLSNSGEENAASVSMMMAMSDRWSVNDFNVALRNMQPDQVSAFSVALERAPVEVKVAALELATGDKSVTPSRLFESQFSGLNTITGTSGDRFVANNEKERITMQARIGLIVGKTEERNHLAGLEVLSAKAGNGRDNYADGIFLAGKSNFLITPGLGILDSSAKREEERLFSSAFPGASDLISSNFAGKKGLDTCFLAETLDRAPYLNSDSAAKSPDLFNRWGVKHELFAEQIERAATKYGEQNLLALDRRMQMFNSLDSTLRERLAGEGKGEAIDAEKLAGLVLNQRLEGEDSPYAFLLGEPALDQQIRQLTSKTRADLQTVEDRMLDKGAEKSERFMVLEQLTKKGVGSWQVANHGLEKLIQSGVSAAPLGFLAGKVDLFESGVEAFAKEQGENLRQFRTTEKSFLEDADRAGNISNQLEQLKFSSTLFEYSRLSQSDAPQERKDYLALMMLDSYGVEALKLRAPQVWNDLNSGALERLSNRNLTQVQNLPEFSGSRGERISQSMDVLVGIHKDESANLDLGIRRRQALEVFDTDPSLQRAKAGVTKFGQEFATFSKLFQSGNEGTKYDDFVKDLKSQAKDLEKIMQSTSAQDIGDLRDLKLKLDSTAREASDPETKQALEARSKSVAGVLELLDPESEQHRKLFATLQDASTRAFQPDTLHNWLHDNGPTIAAAAVAVAITVGSVGTASPVAALLVSSAVALGATQLTKEVLYLTNHYAGDTGLGAYNDRSYTGAWSAKHQVAISKLIGSSDFAGSASAAKELVESYAKEVTGPLSLEYGQNVVMGLVGLGALRLGQSGLNGINQGWVKSLVANPKSMQILELAENSGLASSSRPMMSAWLQRIAAESGKDVAQEFGQEGVSTLAENALRQSQLNSPLTSMVLAASMSLAQGKVGSATTARMHDNSHIEVDGTALKGMTEMLTATGHRVEQLADGSISVSKYSAPYEKLHVSPAPLEAHLSRKGLGVERESDRTIQSLVEALDGASVEKAVEIRAEIAQEMITVGREYAAKLGLVTRDENGRIKDYLISEKDIYLSLDAEHDSYHMDNSIEISLKHPDPTSALWHEMKHMSEMLERTSLYKADPEAFERRLQEDVFGELAQGGNQRITVGDDKLSYEPRKELTNAEQRSAVSSLLKTYAQSNQGHSPAEINSWLASKKAESDHLASIGVDTSKLGSLMASELQHYAAVKDHSILAAEVINRDHKLAKFIDAKAEQYRSVARARHGGVDSNDGSITFSAANSGAYSEPQLHKLTRGITEEGLGIAGAEGHYSVFSGAERRAQAVELTRNIQTLNSQLNSTSAIDSTMASLKFQTTAQRLTSSLAALRSESTANPRVLEQAKQAALDLLPMLPNDDTGRSAAARLISMDLVGSDQLPNQLRSSESVYEGQNLQPPDAGVRYSRESDLANTRRAHFRPLDQVASKLAELETVLSKERGSLSDSQIREQENAIFASKKILQEGLLQDASELISTSLGISKDLGQQLAREIGVSLSSVKDNPGALGRFSSDTAKVELYVGEGSSESSRPSQTNIHEFTHLIDAARYQALAEANPKLFVETLADDCLTGAFTKGSGRTEKSIFGDSTFQREPVNGTKNFTEADAQFAREQVKSYLSENMKNGQLPEVPDARTLYRFLGSRDVEFPGGDSARNQALVNEIRREISNIRVTYNNVALSDEAMSKGAVRQLVQAARDSLGKKPTRDQYLNALAGVSDATMALTSGAIDFYDYGSRYENRALRFQNSKTLEFAFNDNKRLALQLSTELNTITHPEGKPANNSIEAAKAFQAIAQNIQSRSSPKATQELLNSPASKAALQAIEVDSNLPKSLRDSAAAMLKNSESIAEETRSLKYLTALDMMARDSAKLKILEREGGDSTADSKEPIAKLQASQKHWIDSALALAPDGEQSRLTSYMVKRGYVMQSEAEGLVRNLASKGRQVNNVLKTSSRDGREDMLSQVKQAEEYGAPSIGDKAQETHREALRYIDKMRLKIETKLDSQSQKDKASQAIDALLRVTKTSVVHPDTTMDLAFMMDFVATEQKEPSKFSPSRFMTGDTVKTLSSLERTQWDSINHHLSKSDQKILVDALNQNVLNRESLYKLLENPETVNANLAAFEPVIDLLKNTKGTRNAEQAQWLLNIPEKQGHALKQIFDSSDVSQLAFEALTKRASNQPSDSPVVDSLFSSELIARLSAGSDAERLQLKEAVTLLTRHLDGILKHPPELIGKILTAPPSAASPLAAMAKSTRATTAQVEAAIDDVMALSNSDAARARARQHLEVASRDLELYSKISSMQNAELKFELLEAASSPSENRVNSTAENQRTLLTNEQFDKITAAFSSSEEMAALVKTLFVGKTSKASVPSTIESIVNAKLEIAEVVMLSKALTTKSIQSDQVERLMREDSVTRNGLLELASSGRSNSADIALFFELNDLIPAHTAALVDPGASGDQKILAEAEEEQSKRQAAEKRSANDKHLSDVSIAVANKQLKPNEFGRILRDPMEAFELAIKSDLNLHKEPQVVAKQKEFLDATKLLKARLSLGDESALEALSNLRQYIREKVPVEIEGTALGLKALEAKLSHLRWVSENIDSYSNSDVCQLLKNPIRLAAHASGLRNHPLMKSHGQLEFYAHGCLGSDAEKFLAQHSKAFSLEGGRDHKDFFATSQISTAEFFANRVIQKGMVPKGETPRLIGFAIPESTIKMLKAQKLYINRPVTDQPGRNESVFNVKALPYLSDQIYFFPLDEP